MDDVRLDDPSVFVAVAAAVQRRYRERATSISGQMPGYESTVSDEWVVILDGREHRCRARSVEGGEEVEFEGRTCVVRSDWWFGQPLFRGTVDGEPKCFQIESHGVGYRLIHRGVQAEVWVLSPRQAALRALMPERVAPGPVAVPALSDAGAAREPRRRRRGRSEGRSGAGGPSRR